MDIADVRFKDLKMVLESSPEKATVRRQQAFPPSDIPMISKVSRRLAVIQQTLDRRIRKLDPIVCVRLSGSRQGAAVSFRLCLR